MNNRRQGSPEDPLFIFFVFTSSLLILFYFPLLSTSISGIFLPSHSSYLLILTRISLLFSRCSSFSYSPFIHFPLSLYSFHFSRRSVFLSSIHSSCSSLHLLCLFSFLLLIVLFLSFLPFLHFLFLHSLLLLFLLLFNSFFCSFPPWFLLDFS